MLFPDVFHEWSKLDFDLLKMAIFFATVSCFLKEFYISLALLPSADFRLPPQCSLLREQFCDKQDKTTEQR